MKSLCTSLLFTLLLTTFTWGETYRYSPGQAHLLPAAFAELESGDTIVLDRGTYTLDNGLKLNDLSDITIEGQGRVILEVRNLDDPVLEIFKCSRVTVKGLRAEHRQPAGEYQCEGAVIAVRDSQDVLIARNRLNGCGAAGVYAVQSRGVLVYQNKIYNNTFAAVWVTDSQVTVQDNDIYDNAATLSTYGECDISFTGNRIKDNSGNESVPSGYLKRGISEL